MATTSGITNTVTVTRTQIIGQAMKLLRVLPSGGTPTANDLTDCALQLNMILKMFQTKGLLLWLYDRINLPLTQNIVEQFAGDQNLIGVRSRGTLNRPFTVVKEMQANANTRFQAEIGKLQKEVEETNQKLTELQGKKDPNQRFASKEQQDEIEKFKVKRAEANKKLKLVRRDLAKEIESLELRTKVINIAGMPLLVAAVGIGLALVRKQKTKAQ